MPEAQTPPPELPPVQPRAATPPEDPEVVRLRGEVAKHTQTIDDLKRRVTAPPQPAANNQQPPMNNQDMVREFYKDPIGYSAAIANKVVNDQLGNQQAGTFDTLQRVAKDTVRASDPKLFDKYLLEIQANVDTVAPQFRTNVTVWENAFKLVKGNHIDEILAERGQAPPPESPRAPAVHVSPGDGPSPSSSRPAQAPSSTALSQDEKRIAHKLGLTEDQYKAGKEHYHGQNDMVHDPVGKSSWDKMITFDSKIRRREAREARQAQQRKAS